MKQYQVKQLFRICMLLAALALCSAAHAANPPICPHLLGWGGIGNWTQGAPWVKVLYINDAVTGHDLGHNVFYRPYDIPYQDNGYCYDGAAMANLVLARLNSVPTSKWPEAIGFRNEFNDDTTYTPYEFIPYYDTLRAGGYNGWIIYGSYGVGWPRTTDWGLPQVQAAVNKSDGIETHEYFDLTVACGQYSLCQRHVSAINDYPYLATKRWFIGEFGSDYLRCDDPQGRTGWLDREKLSPEQYIAQIQIYRAACADQVVAVFIFQEGSPSGWGNYNIMGTSVADYVQTTWSVTGGTLTGNMKNTSNVNISGASVTTSPSGYNGTTDANGNYTITNITAGTYTVTASKSGYSNSSSTGVTISSGQATTRNFTLTPVSPGTITGNVKNGSNQNISGATISTSTGGYSATTDSNGNYTLSSVNPGTYSVTASKSGYASSTNTGVTVTSGQTTTSNFTLSTASFSSIQNKGFENGSFNDPDADHKTANNWTKFTLSGSPKRDVPFGGAHSGSYSQNIYEASWTAGIYQQATSATSGNNYTGSVWVKGTDSDIRCWVGIDPYGGTDSNSANVQWSTAYVGDGSWAQLTKQVAAQAGTITLFIKAQNLYGNNKYVNIDDADLVDNGTSNTGTICGNVKDGSSANVSGATVSTTSGGYTTTTDANGNYTLASVATGTYSVVASKTGYNSQTQTGKTVNAGATTTCNFTITQQTGAISGNVKNSSSQNLSGATVSTTVGGYTTTSDANGNYTLANVATGTYDVVALKSGYNNQTQTGKIVTNGATTTVSFTLTTSSGITSQDFESMPAWSSSWDATWGSAASWSITSSGQSGNYLQGSRSSGGSSVKTLVYTVPSNTNITVSVYAKCPSYSGGSYWMESACKLGNYSAQDFDANPSTWTIIKKFADNGTNGNNNTWTQYSVSLNTGSNTQLTMGYKIGSSGCAGPVVGWDTFRIN